MNSKHSNTAFLFVDLQNDFLERAGLLPEAHELTEKAASLLTDARSLGAPVIHIHTLVSPDGSDAMPHWKTGHTLSCVKGSRGAESPKELTPFESEKIIQKSFYSGFENGELAMLLEDLQVEEVVIAGLYTHACVRSTALDAYAIGYPVTIALDAIASPEPLHAEITRDFLEKRGIPFCGSNAILEKVRRSVDDQGSKAEQTGRNEGRSVSENPDLDSQSRNCQQTTEISAAITSMAIPRQQWQNMGIPERSRLLEHWKNSLLAEETDWIHLIVDEVHKPIRDAADEFRRAISTISTAIEVALMPSETGTGFRTRYRPIGTVAIITPWNNPMAIPIGKIAPALLFGNAVLWKPSPFAESLAQRLLKSLIKAGLPTGLVNIFNGTAETVREIIRHPSVSAVSLTGSHHTGRIVEALCNAHGKTLQAELGGNNAVIVRPGAVLKDIMPALVRAAFSFSGQRCTATRRFIVDRSIAESFISSFTEETAKLIVGMPMDTHTDLGPLISERHAQMVEEKISNAIRDGAKLIYSGSVPDTTFGSQWIPPTVLLAEDNPSDIVQQETFGPVAVIQLADDVDHALRLANEVRQGLVSGMIGGTTADQNLFRESAEAGMLNIGSPVLSLDMHAPFSGWKDSAIGTPEHGRWDRDFFSRVQAVYHKAE
jgi:alpha-ketoglutaric semialdehyde dehydrogenase